MTDISFKSFQNTGRRYGVQLERTKGRRYIATYKGIVTKLKNLDAVLEFITHIMHPDVDWEKD